MPQRIQLRRGTAAEWLLADPVLAAGELGIELDTDRVKIGDGTSPWTELAYFGSDDSSLAIETAARIAGDAALDARLVDIEDVGPLASAADLAALESALPGTYADIDSVDALDVRVDALEAGGGYDPDATTVLEFTGGTSCHVNHGPFWPLGVDLGHFHWGAWVAPTGEGYLASDGAGGGHALLWGFQGTTLLLVTGNIWPGDTPLTTFGSDDGVEPGEWAAHDVAWNGTTIYVFQDGILTGVTPYSDVRQAGYGQLFAAGSDHQNMPGRLYWMRGFEDSFPLGVDPELGFIPQRFPSSYAFDDSRASFLADYSRPGPVVADLSDGYDGVLHPGTLHASAFIAGRSDVDAGLAGSEPVGPGRASWVVDPAAPFDADGEIEVTGYIPTPPSMPTGAKVWDHFDREKQTWLTRRFRRITTLALTSNVATVTTGTAHGYEAGDSVRVQSSNGIFNGDFTVTAAASATSFTYALVHSDVAPAAATGTTGSFRSLGSTVGGSLGPQRWQYSTQGAVTPAKWGILNGRAVFLFGYGTSRATAWVDTGSADMDVRVTRRTGTYGTHQTGLSLRQEDGTNHYAVATSGGVTTTSVTVVLNLDGTLSYPEGGTFSCPATAWTKLRGVFAGTTLTVYVDDLGGGWTQIGQLTGMTDLSSAAGAGIAAAFGDEIHQLARFDDFTVAA